MKSRTKLRIKAHIRAYFRSLRWNLTLRLNRGKKHHDMPNVLACWPVDRSVKTIHQYQAWIQRTTDAHALKSIFNAVVDGNKPQYINIYTCNWYYTALAHNSPFIIRALANRIVTLESGDSTTLNIELAL